MHVTMVRTLSVFITVLNIPVKSMNSIIIGGMSSSRYIAFLPMFITSFVIVVCNLKNDMPNGHTVIGC
jgi:hypothetical protein